MKKNFCAFLIVTMLFMLLISPFSVIASTLDTYRDIAKPSNSSNISVTTQSTRVFGQSAENLLDHIKVSVKDDGNNNPKPSDTKANYMMSDSTSKATAPVSANLLYPNNTYTDDEYLILDINVAPVSGLDKVSIGPNAAIECISTSDLIDGQWNNIRIVIQPHTRYGSCAVHNPDSNGNHTSNCVAQTESYATMTMYLNGNVVKENYSYKVIKGNEDKEGAYRFTLNGTTSAKDQPVGTEIINAYVADYAVTTSNEVPNAPVMPTLSSVEGEFDILDNKLIPLKKITVSDVIDSGAEVRVYGEKDTEMITPLENDAEIKNGYKVVIEDDNRFSYYTVSTSTTLVEMKSTTVTLGEKATTGNQVSIATGNATFTNVKAWSGKDDDDDSIKVAINKTSAGDKLQSSALLNSTYGIPTNDTSKYIVYAISVFPNKNTEYVALRTTSSNIVGPELYCTDSVKEENDYLKKSLIRNQWNRVVFVIENTLVSDETSTNHKINTYVNGELINDDWLTAKNFGFNNKSLLRFGMYHNFELTDTTKADSTIGYVDDINIYETDLYPDIMSEVPKFNIESTDDYCIKDSKIFLKKDSVSANSFSSALSDEIIKIYNNETKKYELLPTDTTFFGDERIVITKDNIEFDYYDVISPYQVTYEDSGKVIVNLSNFENIKKEFYVILTAWNGDLYGGKIIKPIVVSDGSSDSPATAKCELDVAKYKEKTIEVAIWSLDGIRPQINGKGLYVFPA